MRMVKQVKNRLNKIIQQEFICNYINSVLGIIIITIKQQKKMSSVKHKPMGQSTVIVGGLKRLENKQNLNGDEIREMIQLLKAYETLCIERQDFNGAQSVKNKIQQLASQQLFFKRQKIAVKQKEQIEVICKQGDEEIKKFQDCWDAQIQRLIEQLKYTEQQLVTVQKKEKQELIAKMDTQQVPKIKYSSHVLQKRNYLANLIKSRNYRQAQIVKNTLKEMEAYEETRWVQKFQQKKRSRVEKLQKKQLSQLQAMRLKLEAIFNEKIKERDRKFQILLKKNRKRRVDSSKPSRQRIRTKNGILTQSKFNSNVSFL